MASPVRIANTTTGDPLLKARAQFPGAQDLTYLDTASRGLMPGKAKVAIDQQTDLHVQGRIDKARLFELIERVRKQYSALIKAHPDEIAFTKNVSEGLNMAACAVPWREDDNVILCPELEHPSNVYPWLHLKNRAGI